jgi:hypothetical protein
MSHVDFRIERWKRGYAVAPLTETGTTQDCGNLSSPSPPLHYYLPRPRSKREILVFPTLTITSNASEWGFQFFLSLVATPSLAQTRDRRGILFFLAVAQDTTHLSLSGKVFTFCFSAHNDLPPP